MELLKNKIHKHTINGLIIFNINIITQKIYCHAVIWGLMNIYVINVVR